MVKKYCVSFSDMQCIHSLPQQELLTGWSSMKGGREGEKKIDRERKGRENREEERKADRLSSPPPLGNQGGEDTEGRRRRRRRRRRAEDLCFKLSCTSAQSLYHTSI